MSAAFTSIDSLLATGVVRKVGREHFQVSRVGLLREAVSRLEAAESEESLRGGLSLLFMAGQFFGLTPVEAFPPPLVRVYAARAANGLIKIGSSVTPDKRVQGLTAATGQDVEMVGHVPGGVDLEVRLHEKLAPHRARGEWYQPAPEVLAVVEAIRLLGGQ